MGNRKVKQMNPKASNKPPIHCISCRVTIGENRYRIYSDGSVSNALTDDEIERMGFVNYNDVVLYETTILTRLDPHSTEAKTIRREASRQRANRNARERNYGQGNWSIKEILDNGKD